MHLNQENVQGRRHSRLQLLHVAWKSTHLGRFHNENHQVWPDVSDAKVHVVFMLHQQPQQADAHAVNYVPALLAGYFDRCRGISDRQEAKVSYEILNFIDTILNSNRLSLTEN